MELANYFAAALLMPYETFFSAEQTRYDLDRLAATFAVSLEQAAQRLTTLQRDGRQAFLFFLRIDKAGNVTKRLYRFFIAEHGGACPVWNVHTAFRTPGVILPQRGNCRTGSVSLPSAAPPSVLSIPLKPRTGVWPLRLAAPNACERVIYASG